MLKSRTTSRWALVRYALVIPAAAMLVMCTQKEADVAKLIDKKTEDKAVSDGLSALSKIGLKGEVFTVVEHQPQFPSGMDGLVAYLGKNIKYPEKAVQDGIQGKVFVSFVIAADGSTHDVKVLKGVSKEIDAEAMRVVYDMPRWQPGKQRGKAVNVQYNLPISFSLGDGPNGEKLVPPPPPPAEAPLAPPPPPIPALVILDGKEQPKGFDMDKVDPKQIVSVSVLKGETAKAQYGEKGQDGVVIITTKK